MSQQENRELMELNEHMTDAEILRAIRYLDPDSFTGDTREDRGTTVGICISLLTAFAVALTLVYLRLQTL